MTLASLLRSAVRHLLPAANGTAPPTPSPAVPIAPRPRRIGDILLERRLVTAYQLEGALETQRRSGSRLGQVMLHDGAIDDLGLASAIATQLNLPLLARAEIATDERARDLLPESVARRHRFVPLGVREDSLMVAAEDALSSEATSEVGLHTALRTTVVIAPRSVLDELRHRVYGERHLEVATAELLNRSPEESAYRVLSGRQKIAFCLVLAVSAVAVAIDAVAAAIAFNLLCLAFYSSFSIYKLRLIYRATAHDLELPTSTAEIEALDERDLPSTRSSCRSTARRPCSPALVAASSALDYPRTQLDVLLLCEEDDDETIDAIRGDEPAAALPLVVVPDAPAEDEAEGVQLRPDPGATATYVVIYDAEDRPDPDQLKKVVVAFRKSDPNGHLRPGQAQLLQPPTRTC